MVEASTKDAKLLCERFYALPKPGDSAQEFPYTGPYMFVPLLMTKEWAPRKIFQLARVHVKLCQNLRAIFLENMQDIRNIISNDGQTLLCRFLGMRCKQSSGEAIPVPLIHNTGKMFTKVMLVPSENYDDAIDPFSAVHPGLLTRVVPEYHDKVFVEGKPAAITSGHRDSLKSCESSSYALALLSLYNPQDGEDPPDAPTSKRLHPAKYRMCLLFMPQGRPVHQHNI
jgi:hypothetical protein